MSVCSTVPRFSSLYKVERDIPTARAIWTFAIPCRSYISICALFSLVKCWNFFSLVVYCPWVIAVLRGFLCCGDFNDTTLLWLFLFVLFHFTMNHKFLGTDRRQSIGSHHYAGCIILSLFYFKFYLTYLIFYAILCKVFYFTVFSVDPSICSAIRLLVWKI